MHIHVRMGGACSRVRSDPGWPYQHSRAWNARGSRYTCHVGPPAQSRRGMPSVPPSSAVRHVPARPRAPVHRRAPQRACRRYIKHGTQVPGVPYPNPSITNIHGGLGCLSARIDPTVTPAQGSLSLSIIIHKRDTGSSAPLRHRVVRKHMPPFILGYPSPSAVSPWYPHAQL